MNMIIALKQSEVLYLFFRKLLTFEVNLNSFNLHFAGVLL